MKKWALLAGAIVSEVAGTMLLRASVDHAGWSVGVVAGYLAAFGLLGMTLREGLPVGVAYGVWGATGVALTAVLGSMVFGETLSPVAMVGIAVIIVGVLVVQTGGARSGDEERVEVGR
ncbi:DMT family transporter [Gordonia neofelifaecis]|uniref:DMT family transporter n=1 Tax=Gordonia neofelifaecis TaxID=945692 RepID=UPI0002F682F1|nr:multidrug efflux SMR transporter [Gordonia neofelifaecis]